MLRRLLFTLSIISAFFLTTKIVNAETFTFELNNEGYNYQITKDNTNYFNSGYIYKDSQGNIAYSLSPIMSVPEKKDYVEKASFMYSEELVKEIERIAYFGYGYKDRTEEKWYLATQYIIWSKTIPEYEIFYTIKGIKQTNPYLEEISLIEQDVKNSLDDNFKLEEYTVNYNENLDLNIPSNYILEINNEIIDNPITNIKEDIELTYYQDLNYYDIDTKYYNGLYQCSDVIVRGNIESEKKTTQIYTTKGKLELNIINEKELYKDELKSYSVESEFKDICYIIKSNNIEQKICTDKEIKYQTDYLPYDTYIIKQLSTGTGYQINEEEYTLIIDENNELPSIDLNNNVINNNIVISIGNRENYEFRLYDSKDNLVDTIKSKYYNIKLNLGYGTYYLEQITESEKFEKLETIKLEIKDKTPINIKVTSKEKINNEQNENNKEPEKEEIKEEQEEKNEEEIIEKPIQEDNIIKEENGQVLGDSHEFIKEEITNQETNNQTEYEITPPNTNTFNTTQLITLIYTIGLIVIRTYQK